MLIHRHCVSASWMGEWVCGLVECVSGYKEWVIRGRTGQAGRLLYLPEGS